MIDDFAPFGKNKQKSIPDPNNNFDEVEEIESFESPFRPPENYEVSEMSRTPSSEPLIDDESPLEIPDNGGGKPPGKKSFIAKIKNKMPDLSKKQWAIVISIAVILIAGMGYVTWKVFFNAKPQQTATPVVEAPKEEPPKPTTAASKLTGMVVSIPDSELPVTAIMVENSPDARPQSGLKDAGVVYEAIAEGGITRFLTLFQESQPDYIGPVRSVRPYYLDWLVPFDAPVAHVGGSGEALAQIRNEGIKDLDYGSNSGSYQRVSSRYAPHNVYTSRAQMIELQKSKGWTTSSFTGWARKEDKPSTAPNAKTIDFAISGFLYNPHYDYDTITNSYKRSQAGKPHVDEKSGLQISPKVVIAIVVPRGIHPDGVHTVYGTIGSGKAYFFQDGTVTEGIWEKKDRKSEMRFGDANGSPLAINKGNTWVSAVSEASAVTFAP